MNRRFFLSGMVAAPPMVSLQLRDAGLGPIGLQLFTIRPELEKNFERTLAQVAAIGYKELEFAGYFGRTPQQIQAALRANGLMGVSGHADWASLGERWAGVVDTAHAIGLRHLVITALDRALRTKPDIWGPASEQLNRAGEVCKAAGIKLGYHNHLFEFARIEGGGKRPYDTLMESTDPSLVSMQMDLAWIVAAGEDPVRHFQMHPGRFLSVHAKDLKRLPPRPSNGGVADRDTLIPDLTEVGAGALEWPRVLADCQMAGIRHYFVEHDAPAAPLSSAAASFRYLSTVRLQGAAR